MPVTIDQKEEAQLLDAVQKAAALVQGGNTPDEAVEKAFERLAAYRQGRQVYIPYKMGCDRARGEWGTYSEIIDRVCPGVIACKLPN